MAPSGELEPILTLQRFISALLRSTDNFTTKRVKNTKMLPAKNFCPYKNLRTLVVSVPSFPHAFSENPGGFRTGPPIKTFGGDELGCRAQISSSVGERKLMNRFVVNIVFPQHPTHFISRRFRSAARSRFRRDTLGSNDLKKSGRRERYSGSTSASSFSRPDRPGSLAADIRCSSGNRPIARSRRG